MDPVAEPDKKKSLWGKVTSKTGRQELKRSLSRKMSSRDIEPLDVTDPVSTQTSKNGKVSGNDSDDGSPTIVTQGGANLDAVLQSVTSGSKAPAAGENATAQVLADTTPLQQSTVDLDDSHHSSDSHHTDPRPNSENGEKDDVQSTASTRQPINEEIARQRLAHFFEGKQARFASQIAQRKETANATLAKFFESKKSAFAPQVTVILKEKLKGSLTAELVKCTDDLKAKLKTKNHQEKITKIHDEILEKLTPLAEEASEEKLKEFTDWFDAMLDSHKNDFPEENWIWHDVVRPALSALVGVVFSLMAAIAMPFVTGLAGYAGSFFEKPKTAGFQAFEATARDIKKSTEEAVPATVESISALSPAAG